MLRFRLRSTLVFLMFLPLFAPLLSCGGDDGPAQVFEPNWDTGHFIDSYVRGLHYVSGSVSGNTDAEGRFNIDGNSIEFSVGDIVLGSAVPFGIMSPIVLVVTATDETDPVVTNIARFLQTIDDDGSPGNGIVITAAVRAAAAGKTLNFNQTIVDFENDANVLSVMAALTAATQAGARPLIDASVAQANLVAGIRSQFAQTFYGDYCRDVGENNQVHAGTWEMDVALDGSVQIGFDGNPTFIANGTMDLKGNVAATGPGGIEVYLTPGVYLSGTWSYGEQSGSLAEETTCSN